MKKLRGFSFSINMANFEAFCRTKKLISNLFFLKSDKSIWLQLFFISQQISWPSAIVKPSFYPFPMSLIICFSIINIIDIYNEYIIKKFKWSKTMPLPKFFLSPSATKLKTFDLFYNIDYIDRVQMIRPYNARSLRQWNCVYDKRSYWQNCKACEYTFFMWNMLLYSQLKQKKCWPWVHLCVHSA